jgi:hypothetical protein
MLNFYLYSITAISLGTFYLAAIVVVSGILRLGLAAPGTLLARENAMEMVAGAFGYLVIALPLWWLHWRWLRIEFAHADGTEIPTHRFYLFTIVCLNALAVLLLGSLGIAGIARMGLGVAGPGDSDLAEAGVFLFAMALSGLLWLHHWNQFKGGRGKLLPENTPEGGASITAS